MNDEVIAFLKQTAAKRCHLDDEEFNPMDASGGNFDDAYDMGVRDGEISMAQQILAKLGIEV